MTYSAPDASLSLWKSGFWLLDWGMLFTHSSMDKQFQDYSWIQEFEADVSIESQLHTTELGGLNTKCCFQNYIGPVKQKKLLKIVIIFLSIRSRRFFWVPTTYVLA